MTAPTYVSGSYAAVGIETAPSPDLTTVTIGSALNQILFAVMGQEILTSSVTQYSAIELRNGGGTVVANFVKAGGDVIQTVAGTSGSGLELWYILAANLPAPGTYTLHPTTNAAGARWVNSVFCVKDAVQSVIAPIFAKTNSAAQTLAVSVTPPTNNALILNAFTADIPSAQTLPETSIGQTTSGSNGLRVGIQYFAQATAAAKSMSAGLTSGNYGRAIAAGWYVEEIAGDGITCTSPVEGYVAQRRPTSASVVVGGTYNGPGTIATIEAQVTNAVGGAVVKAWTALTSPSITGGVCSGTLSGVPQGGLYYAALRSKDAGGTVLATSSPSGLGWGVGKVIPLAGSSTGEYMATQASVATPDPLISRFDGTTYTRPTIGGGVINFSNQQVASEPGIPVCVIPGGRAGSGLANWVQGTSYFYYQALLTAVQNQGGYVEAFWDAATGGNDARGGGNTNVAWGTSRYLTYLSLVRTDFLSGVYATLPVLHGGIQRSEGTGETGVDQNWTDIRAAEMTIFNDPVTYPSNFFYESIDLGLDATDHIHPTSANFEILGRRASRVFAARALGLSVAWRSPAPVSAVYAGTNCDVTFTVYNGTGIVNSKNTGTFDIEPTCFVVRNSGGTVQTVTSATITTTTTVRLVVPAGLSLPITVEYMPGRNPGTGVGPAGINCVYDNGAAA